MESNPHHITHDFPPFFRVHSSGRIERYLDHDFVPPSHHPQTDVISRDVHISPENTTASARIYLPGAARRGGRKLPLLIYIHGGAFSIESAFSSLYHSYANTLASRTRSLVVSVEYRLAPEHPIPACYDDSFAVAKWVGSHYRDGSGPDQWLNEYADFSRAYAAGDSAGANIAHDLVVRAGDGLGFGFTGLILIHPFFGMGRPDRLWDFICPGTTGPDDVRLNPAADMELLSKLGVDRVLVCVAERDFLRKRGLSYCEKLRESGWRGVVELFESPEKEHVFHLMDPVCDGATALMDRVVGFINCGAAANVMLSHF